MYLRYFIGTNNREVRSLKHHKAVLWRICDHVFFSFDVNELFIIYQLLEWGLRFDENNLTGTIYVWDLYKICVTQIFTDFLKRGKGGVESNHTIMNILENGAGFPYCSDFFGPKRMKL